MTVPEPGASRAEDYAQRDAAVASMDKLAVQGCDMHVRLHANLDDEEIARCIKRYAGRNFKFVMAEEDSTPEQRQRFVIRWLAAGGRAVTA